MQETKVLLVEDDRLIIENLTEFLRRKDLRYSVPMDRRRQWNFWKDRSLT